MNVTTDEQMAYAVITGKGNYAGTAKEKFRILPRSLSGAAVSGYSDSVPYTGSEVTFADIVVTCAGEVLTADADYTVKYVGNSSVTADDDTYFVVTGCGNYTGEKTVHFTITKKNISDCDAQEIESQVWTGKEIKPDVTIKNGTILLVHGVDYDITYSANVAETTDTAKAKAVVTGKGNYTGKIIKEFVIARKLIDISGASVKAIPDQTYAFGRDITPAQDSFRHSDSGRKESCAGRGLQSRLLRQCECGNSHGYDHWNRWLQQVITGEVQDHTGGYEQGSYNS